MVGDGPDRPECERLAHREGLKDRIDFLGKLERVDQLLPLADLMLMPSEMESFGLVALEAMACEVPTIGTDVGGVPEVITDGETGLLYPVGDIEGMSDGALQLLSDRAKLREMGKRARRSAQNRFCSTRIVPLYEQYYDEVLARSR